MTREEEIRAALPGYDIGGVVGRGGCGEVLTGFHRGLQRQVAIKQIPQQFADDPEVRRRFVTEARSMAAIDHPHVVPVYDYVEQGNLCLLVMEYLPAGTVADRFASYGFDATSAIAVALSCAAGLDAAHRLGVLHRDVKPSNLIFAANGVVKLSDFGIAKIVGGGDVLATRTGEVVGTPVYMAPEQIQGQKLSPATDVYSLATMLYQLLSGVLPFPSGEDSLATLFMRAFEQPTPLVEVAPAVPAPIADVVMQGLATNPAERFSSAESFGVALAGPAADCWGSDWLAPVGIPLIGADTIVAAATGSGRRTGMPEPAQQETIRSVSGTSAGGSTRIRPTQPLPRPQVELADVDPADVIPVQDVVKLRGPGMPFAIAGLLGIAAVLLAVVGVGSPPRGGDLPPGTLTVAGVDPATAQEVDVDLSKPIPVAVTGVDGDAVALGVNVLGASVGKHAAPLVPGQGGRTALVPPPVNAYVLAGSLTGDVTVLKGDTPTATYRFGMHTSQRAITTTVAVVTVLLALFAAAYVESYIRTLRRGRSRFSASFGVPLSAAALAVAAIGAVWVLLGREPTIATIVVSAAVAAASGIAATVGAKRMGRKYRYRRSRRRRQPARP